MDFVDLRQLVMNLTTLEVPHANRLLQQGFTEEEKTQLGTLLEQGNIEDSKSLIKSKDLKKIFPNPRIVDQLNNL